VVPLDIALLETTGGTLRITSADRLCVTVEDLDGEPVSGESCLEDPGNEGAGAGPDDPGAVLLVEPVDLGGPYRALVELVAEGRVLGRGRSFPFRVDAAGPDRPVRVLVGEVGRFGPAFPTVPWGAGSRPAGVAATADGALVGTSDGLVYRMGTGADGLPTISLVSTVPARAGARWAALADGALIAVGGVEAGATLFAPDGSIASTTTGDASELLAPHRVGAAVVAADPGSLDAWVFGGATPGEPEPSRFATRIRRTPRNRLEVEPLQASLPRGQANATPVLLRDVVEGGDRDPRTLLFRGGDPGEVLVFDPARPQMTRREPLPDGDDGAAVPIAPGAALTALADELVLAAGGRPEPGRASGDVRILQLGTDGRLQEPLAEPRLETPRSQAAVVTFGEDAALVVGGLTEGEVGTDTAEVVQIVRRFEVEVRPVNAPLPTAFPSPLATRLGDGTVLVVDATGVAVWFP